MKGHCKRKDAIKWRQVERISLGIEDTSQGRQKTAAIERRNVPPAAVSVADAAPPPSVTGEGRTANGEAEDGTDERDAAGADAGAHN